jgi:hypothetical protein
MKCTCPCIPPCGSEAAFALLNMKSRALLGFNCEMHVDPLVNNPAKDYDKKSLPEEKKE